MEELLQNEEVETELVEDGEEYAVGEVDDFEEEDDSSSKDILLGTAIGVGVAAGATFLYKKAIKPGLNWARDKILEKAQKSKDAETQATEKVDTEVVEEVN